MRATEERRSTTTSSMTTSPMALSSMTMSSVPRSRLAWFVIIVLLLLAAAAVGEASAQTRRISQGGSVLESLRGLRGGSTEVGEPLPTTPTTPLEAPIDPERYRLFPGDELHLGVWGGAPGAWIFVVSPEGDLVLPKAGPVHVAGLTLREAEELVRTSLRPAYGKATVTLRLLSPARFLVSVTGMVGRPGVYETSGVTRLSTVLDLAGGVRPGGSVRRIGLRSEPVAGGDPLVKQVDLLRWALGADPEANPAMTPGVSIEVPAQQAAVRLRGPVNGTTIQASTPASARVGDRPDEEADLSIEVRPGDTAGLLLDQVGGLSDRATGSGLLRRAGQAPIDLDLTGEEGRKTALSAGDTLDIAYARRWIYVTGAVRVPGRVPHYPGLTAHDYVNMVGGPTEIGRTSGWWVETPDGTRGRVDRVESIPVGTTVRVPERRAYKATSWLAPLSTATALLISIVALTN